MKRLWGSSIAARLGGVSSGALAADLTKAPPVPVAPLYNWNGFYIGFNFGGAFPNGTFTDDFTVGGVTRSASFTTNHDMGFVGGGQIGYNWQVSPNFVLGVEGMFDGAQFNDNAEVTIVGENIAASANMDWIATATGRIGYAGNLLGNILGNTAQTNSTLYYVKGGGAWVKNSITVTDFGPVAHFSDSISNTRSGWVVGGGIEYGVLPNFTVKVEYDYIGLGTLTRTDVFAGPPIIANTASLSRNINMFTVGANYKFCLFAGC